MLNSLGPGAIEATVLMPPASASSTAQPCGGSHVPSGGVLYRPRECRRQRARPFYVDVKIFFLHC